MQTFDTITPFLQGLAGRLRETRPLMAGLGGELQNRLRAHFAARDAEGNANGWPRSHFWSKAVRQHTLLSSVTEHMATVSIASVEFLHKLRGGTITAPPGKALSIPISPDAKRAGSASLFPRPLTMVIRPGRPPLLIETGTIGKSRAWKLHYVLLKSVTHAPDPRALPEHGTLTAALMDRAAALTARLMASRSA